MSSKKLTKNKEAIRRIEKRNERREDTKESELKKIATSKARAKPLSIASKIVLREEEEKKNPTPGFSDIVRNKHENSSKNPPLPKDKIKAMVYARNELRATPRPNEYYNSLQ